MWWQDKRTGESASLFFFLSFFFFSLLSFPYFVVFLLSRHIVLRILLLFFFLLSDCWISRCILFFLPTSFFFFSPGWRCLISIFPSFFFYFGRVLFLFSAFFFLLSFVKHHSVQLQNLNRHFRIRSFNDTFFLTLFACFLFLFLYFQIPQRVRRCAYTETFLFSFSVLLFFFCFLSFLLCAFKYTWGKATSVSNTTASIAAC